MPKFATKAADNMFCQARYEAAKFNERLSSREGAAEELGVDRTRLARIELGSVTPYPEESFNEIMKIRDEPESKDIPVEKRKFQIKKSDDEKMQAFGWANISITADGEVLEDLQHDIIEPEELEQAAYKFVDLYREGGEMHIRGGVARLIESAVFTKEKMEAMGIPEGTLPTGWWIGFQVTDADVWEKVKDGTYSMFSIEGEAKRVEVEDEESDQ